MALVGVITGIIALMVSGIVAWKNYLSPFRLKVYCGSPRLEPCKLHLEGGIVVTRFSVLLPLYFVNTGARDGIISDIALIVRSAKNTWLFQPFFYAKYSVQTEATLGKKLTEDPSNEPFYPIHLIGKEKVYKSIVFASLPNERFPLGENPLLPGTYGFQVQTLEASKKGYEAKLTFNIKLSEETVNELASPTSPTYLIPFTEEIKAKRQSLRID